MTCYDYVQSMVSFGYECGAMLVKVERERAGCRGNACNDKLERKNKKKKKKIYGFFPIKCSAKYI